MNRARLLLIVVVALPVCAAAFAQAGARQVPDERQAGGPAPAPQDATAAQQQPTAEAQAKPAGFIDLRRYAPVHGDAAAGQAKASVCAACHGPTGTAIAPIFPNLAGQSMGYLYRELVEYQRVAAPDSPMTPLVAELSDQDMKDLAAYFSSQAPSLSAAAADAPPLDDALLQRGRNLYENGDAARGVPPCQGCHGSDARGHPLARRADRSGDLPYAAYPALRGQQDAYLQARLGAFRDGALQHSSADRVMSGVAERLDADSIQALSAWLSSLPP